MDDVRRSCPFCGGENLALRRTGLHTLSVVCLGYRCQAEGPKVDTMRMNPDEGASATWTKWNDRRCKG
jgi:hypothetical protein